MAVKITVKPSESGGSTWGSIRSYSISFLIRAAVVAGWFLWRSNPYYNNFIFLLHFYLWFLIVVSSVAVIGILMAAQKISTIKSGDTMIASGRVMYLSSCSWFRKLFFNTVQIPTVAFIGIAKADYSLMVAFGLADLAQVLLLAAGADFYKKIPDEIKYPEGKPDGTEAEAAGMKKNPVKKIYDSMVEQRKKDEAEAAHIAEHILEDNEEDVK